MFHSALPFFFLGLAVLADASAAFAIVSHPNCIQILYFTAQSALYAASRGLLSNSLLPVPIPAYSTFPATPVDRSLIMRALGGAITSPCSNDSESWRPTTTILGLSPHLLFHCWMLLDSPIPTSALSGRRLIVFCVHTWLVQLPLYYRVICIVNSFVSADRRATARTTTSLSHAAIRKKKTTLTKPLGGLCFFCSLTALCRLEAHNNSANMAWTQNFCEHPPSLAQGVWGLFAEVL